MEDACKIAIRGSGDAKVVYAPSPFTCNRNACYVVETSLCRLSLPVLYVSSLTPQPKVLFIVFFVYDSAKMGLCKSHPFFIFVDYGGKGFPYLSSVRLLGERVSGGQS